VLSPLLAMDKNGKDHNVCFQWKHCYIYFQYAIGQWKNIFQNSESCQIHFYGVHQPYNLWLVIHFHYLKSTCGLTGWWH